VVLVLSDGTGRACIEVKKARTQVKMKAAAIFFFLKTILGGVF